MKKIILLILTSTIFLTNLIHSHNLVFWEVLRMTGDINKYFALDISNKNWFSQDTSVWTESDFDPIIKLKTSKSSSLGFDPSYSFYYSNSHEIIREFTPKILIRNSFKLADIGLNSLISMQYRTIENATNRGTVAFLLGTELFRHKKVSLSVAEKVYYNYYKTNEIDSNRVFINLEGRVSKLLDLSFLYVWQIAKLGEGISWQDTNFLSLVLTFKI